MINRRTSGYHSRSGYRRPGSGGLRRGRRSFLRRHSKMIAAAVLLLAAGAVCIALFAGGGKEAVAQLSPDPSASETASATPVATIDLSEFSENYNYEGVGEDVIAGLEGGGEDVLAGEIEEVLVTSGSKIGITIGDIENEHDKMLLGKLEEATGDAYGKGLVYEVYCYDAQGDYNQQLQDVRSLIKNGVDVIIAGSTDEESFKMISFMAHQEGIPLVAYDAPVDSGYAANVISDQASWGGRYGQFIADNLKAGNVVEILGSESSAEDKARKAAIDGKLSANPALSVLAAYVSWNEDKAKDKISDMLEDDVKIDGAVASEGLAESMLDAFIEKKALPKVMCGDTTAGFIKKWYALKNSGVVIVPPAVKKRSQPPAEMFSAKPGEFIVCAQPAPARAAAIAFEIALKLAEGRTLVSEGVSYEYSSDVFITDSNLGRYYDMVKDMPDSYSIADAIDSAEAESLFNPE